MGGFELNNGTVIVNYDEKTFEILCVESWNGDDLTDTVWDEIAIEKVEQLRLAKEQQ